MTWNNGGSINTLAARWRATSPMTERHACQPQGWLRMRLQTIMSSAEHIYSIADNHAQTVQVCIDRLHQLGANEQLRVLIGRLQRLAVRANPGDDDKGT
jgi:hypothetical protein